MEVMKIRSYEAMKPDKPKNDSRAKLSLPALCGSIPPPHL